MKIFNSQAEVDAALNSDGNLVVADDVQFKTDVRLDGDIDAWDITARDITAWDINAENIDAEDITAWDINAENIDAEDINAGNINAENIDAEDINAGNIDARNIDARNIDYYAACLAYESFRCRSVKGRRDNALHACLDQEIEFIKEAK